MNQGDTIPISAPAEDFYLDMDCKLPLVLINGGVGLTPLMSMLNTVTSQGTERDVYWIHAAVNSKYLASKKHANDPAASNRHVKPFIIYEKPTVEDRESKLYDEERYITLDFLHRVLPSKQCDFYFCGLEPFMRAVSRALKQWEITEERIH